MSVLKEKLAHNILFLTVGTLFTWSLASAIISCTEFMQDYWLLLFQIAVVMLTIRIILINKYTLIFTLIIVMMATLFIFIDIITNDEMPDIYLQTAGFIYRVWMYAGGYLHYTVEYETTIVWIIVILTSVLTSCFTLFTFRYMPLLAFSSIVFAICFSSGYYYFNECFVAYLFCILVYTIKQLNMANRGGKTENRSNAIFSLCATPLVVFCIIFAKNIPVPEQGTAVKLVEEAVNKPFYAINDVLYGIFNPKFFSLSTTGYSSSSGRLGGNVYTNDNVVMEVKSDEPLYLIGSIKDKYTGYSWESTMRESVPFSFDDKSPIIELLERASGSLIMSINETMVRYMEDASLLINDMQPEIREYYANRIFAIETKLSMFNEKKAVIDIREARTCSVFFPAMMTNILMDSGSIQYMRTGTGDITVTELLEQNTSYSIYYRKNFNDDNFWNMVLNNSSKGLLEKVASELEQLHKMYDFKKEQLLISTDYGFNDLDYQLHISNLYAADEEYFNPDKSLPYEDLINILIPYTKAIYEQYTVLPETFPQRVVDLAHDITANAESDYEKAAELEAFLKQFPYTLEPDGVPYGRDFVDYFLFDLKEGYCTYFATAFVTMCRAIGLPARYLEGYMMPSEKNENGVYVVTNKNGHAWPEVYFEGYGWHMFEPTPSSDTDNDESIISAFSPQYEDAYGSDYRYENEYLNHPDYQSNRQQGVGASGDNVPNSSNFYRNILIASCVFISMLALIGFSVRIFFVNLNVRSINKKSNNEAAIIYFHMILKYAKHFHYSIYDNETAVQYAVRIGKVFSFENDSLFMTDIADIFSKAQYGNADISSREREIMKQAYKTLDDKLRFTTNKRMYMFYRYFGIV